MGFPVGLSLSIFPEGLICCSVFLACWDIYVNFFKVVELAFPGFDRECFVCVGFLGGRHGGRFDVGPKWS